MARTLEWYQREGEKLPLLDMHAHLKYSFELELREKAGMVTCFSAGTPEEWLQLQEKKSKTAVISSFGIHPWYAGQYSTELVKEELEQCDYIGEIGMDTVWCQVPEREQQKKLEQQLQIAADQKKSVLLHTKGAEDTIAELVKDFPEPVCIHWYSGTPRQLEAFLEKDCYFTLGPDLSFLSLSQGKKSVFEKSPWNGREQVELYEILLRELPLERLFLETDGADAIAWAMGKRSIPIQQIPAVLQRNLVLVSERKQETQETVKKRMWENLLSFRFGLR